MLEYASISFLALETQCQDETILHLGPAFCQYHQPEIQENYCTDLTSSSFCGLFSYPHSIETLKKMQAYRYLQHVSTCFDIVNNWPYPFVMLSRCCTPRPVPGGGGGGGFEGVDQTPPPPPGSWQF